MPKSWRDQFDKRELEEIEFCTTYKLRFGHGTLGHNIRMIVAKMADILDNMAIKEYAEKAKRDHTEKEDAEAKKRGDELRDRILKENPLKPIPMVIHERLDAMGVSQMRGLTKKDKENFEELERVKARKELIIVDFESPPEMDGLEKAEEELRVALEAKPTEPIPEGMDEIVERLR